MFASVYSFSQTIEGTTSSALTIDIYKVDVVTPAAVTGVDVDSDIPLSGKTYSNRYALIIGNSDYQTKSDLLNINFALNDARIFKTYCKNILGLPEKNIFYIENASAMDMNEKIDDFVSMIELKTTAGEFYIYYSGHGTYNSAKEAFLVPVDVKNEYVEKYAIKLSDFYDKLNTYETKKTVVFLDACFSGGGKTGQLLAAKSGVKIVPNKNVVSSKMLVLAATSEDQIAQESADKQHGLFTYYLLSNLKESKGNITYGDLSDKIIEDVFLETLNSKTLIKQKPCVNVSPSIESVWKTWKVNE